MADSRMTSVVSEVISELRPPIIPAIITGFSPSVMMMSFGSSSTSFSLSKVNFSPLLASLTSNFPLAKVLAS